MKGVVAALALSLLTGTGILLLTVRVGTALGKLTLSIEVETFGSKSEIRGNVMSN